MISCMRWTHKHSFSAEKHILTWSVLTFMTNFKDCSVLSLCIAYFVATFGRSNICSGGSTLESDAVAVFPLPCVIQQPLWEQFCLCRLVLNCNSSQSSGHITARPWVWESDHFTQFNIFYFTYRTGTILRPPGGEGGCGGGRVWDDKLSIGFPYVLPSSGKNSCCYGNTRGTIKQARRINFPLWALCCHPPSLVPVIGEDPSGPALGSGAWQHCTNLALLWVKRGWRVPNTQGRFCGNPGAAWWTRKGCVWVWNAVRCLYKYLSKQMKTSHLTHSIWVNTLQLYQNNPPKY